MRKIYLFCNAGMSTSLLVSSMQDAAFAHNIPVEVKAYSHTKLDEVIEKEIPDCMLLGPQVKHLFKDIVKRYPDIPVDMIDPDEYGFMRGDAVLKRAVVLIQNHQIQQKEL